MRVPASMRRESRRPSLTTSSQAHVKYSTRVERQVLLSVCPSMNRRIQPQHDTIQGICSQRGYPVFCLHEKCSWIRTLHIAETASNGESFTGFHEENATGSIVLGKFSNLHFPSKSLPPWRTPQSTNLQWHGTVRTCI
jgi:hypothetical protein